MKLLALHGFLGQSSDWDPVLSTLKPEKYFAPDLFAANKDLLSGNFEQFCEAISPDWNAVIGYSMGGRLALHLALKFPERFSKVVLLSTHIGLFDEPHKQERRTWEAQWVEKITEAPWEEFVRDWNAQPIFTGNGDLERKEQDFDRDILVRAIWDFSSARHQFSLKQLSQHTGSFTWVVGARDEKYLKHLEEIQMLRGDRDKYLIVPNAGHRLLLNDDRSWVKSL